MAAIPLLFSTQQTVAQIVSEPATPRFERQVWIGPQGLPAPLPSAIDVLEMFKLNAPWKDAAAHVQVFKIYGAFLGHADQADVNIIVADLKRRHIAIAVEVGVMNVPHNPASSCGGLGNVEGYGTVALATKISHMIKEAGGEIKYIAMDEPFYYGHYFTHAPGKGEGCHSSISEILALSVPTLKEFIHEFPDITIGDTEPTILTEHAQWKKDLLEWTQGFKAAMGRPLEFLQLDVEWPLRNGKQTNGVNEALALYAFSETLIHHEQLRTIGIIYNGTPSDTTDKAWCEGARDHLMLMEGKYKLRPQQVIFQSWNANPTHVMPDWSRDTLTGLVLFLTSSHQASQ